MKKIITAMLFCTPLSALAADSSVDLKFTGTLLQPTCVASFVGTNGADINFGEINASDYVTVSGDTVTPAVDGALVGTKKDVFVQFSNCSGISKFLINFSTTDGGTNGPFSNKLAIFRVADGSNLHSGLGLALFTNKDATAPADAIQFLNSPTNKTYLIDDLVSDKGVYKLPLFARIAVANRTYVDTKSEIHGVAGHDLSATASVNIEYQ